MTGANIVVLASWIHFILFLIIIININTISFVTAQTILIEISSCRTDPDDSSRNILEITGDRYDSASVVISDTIDNCDIYIHDLTVSSIKFTSPITNNSNITIRNVTSSDKSIATFIWFVNTTTNFSFINISNIYHSSLKIDTATENDWISLVKFEREITGKSDQTSWIAISGLEMKDAICNRTNLSSTVCISAMVYFGSTIASCSSVDLNNFSMDNVSMSSNASATSFISAIDFIGALSQVQNISITNFVVRNVNLRNNFVGGPSQIRMINIMSTISAVSQSIRISEFTVRDHLIENVSSIADRGDSDWRFLHVDGAISNFNNIRCNNISAKFLSSKSSSGSAQVSLIRFMSSITVAPVVSLPLSLLVMEDIRFASCSSIGYSTVQLLGVTFAGVVSGYGTIQVRSITAESLVSQSISAVAYLSLVQLDFAVKAPSFVSILSSSPTSFLIDNVRLQDATSTGASSYLWFFYGGGGMTNFNTINVTNLGAGMLNATALSGATYLYFFLVSALQISSSSSSSCFVNNIQLRNVSSTADSSSRLSVLSFGGVANYNNICFSNISAMEFTSTSSSSDSSLHLVRFRAPITTSTSTSSSSSSSSFVINNIQFERGSSLSGSAASQLYAVIFEGAVDNFVLLQVSNLSATSLSSSSSSSSEVAALYLVVFKSSVTAPARSSKLLIDSFLIQSVSSNGVRGSTVSFVYFTGVVSKFTNVQISNISAVSASSVASDYSAKVYAVYFETSISGVAFSSPRPPPSLLVANVRLERAEATGHFTSQIFVFYVSKEVSNFSYIHISNVTAANLNALDSLGSSYLYLAWFASSITALVSASSSSTLQIDNIQAEDGTSVGLIGPGISIVLVGGAVTDFTNLVFSNIGAKSLISASKYFSSISLLSLSGTVTAPSIGSSSLRVTGLLLKNVSSSASSSSSISCFYVGGAASNYNEIHIRNISATTLNSNSSSGGAFTHIILFGSLVTAPASFSNSSLQIDNVRLRDATSTGGDSGLHLVRFIGAVTNYTEIALRGLSATSVVSITSSGASNVLFIYFDSSITASSSSSSSSLLVNFITIESVSSTGRTTSAVQVFSVAGSVANYNTLQFSNFPIANCVSSSNLTSTTYAVYVFGGLSNCSSLQLQNIRMKNMSASSVDSTSPSVISVLSFVPEFSYNNISLISLQNCGIQQITISSRSESVVRLFNARWIGIQSESIIINNNSLKLSSNGNMSVEFPISVAVVEIRTFPFPLFTRMEVTNNVLSVFDQNWRNICSSTNCSIVRVGDVSQQDIINNNKTNNMKIPSDALKILVSTNEITPRRSSFISFGNFSDVNVNNIKHTLINFVLEDNIANFTSTPDGPWLLGFDSPPPSSSFPSLVAVVEVKCNRWPRTVDRDYEQQLLSIASSPSQLHSFINWTCKTDSPSPSDVRSVSATSSASTSTTPTSSSSPSFSQIRNSKSRAHSETQTPDVTATSSTSISVSPQRTRSATFSDGNFSSTLSRFTSSETLSESASQYKNPSPFVLKISEPVNSALAASDGTQAAAMLSVAVFASIASSPALGFTIGRQQAMMDFAQKSIHGDCRGLLPATTMKNFEDEVSNPLGLGNSPTQMPIGGSEKLMSYYVGAVIGNCILIVGLVVLNQGIGMGARQFLNSRINWIRKFVKKSKITSMMKEQCGAFNKKESLIRIIRRVFAKSYVSLTLFFCLSFLLTPTLSSALIVLVAAKNDPKLESHQVPWYLKLVSLVCAFFFLFAALYFVIWSAKLRRKMKEKYRSLKELGIESDRTEKTIFTWLFKASGEWRYPAISNVSNIFSTSGNEKKKKEKESKKYETSYSDFLIAEPAFESYRTTIWFSIVEVAAAISLALPPFFAQFASSGKSSCMIQGILLLIILLVYTTILIWKNPFKLRILRIANPILSLQQLVIVSITFVFVAMRNGNNSYDETPAWFWRILVVPLGFQSLMSVMMIVAAFFPILVFLKKFQGRARKARKAE